MVGDLATAVHLQHRDIATVENVLRAPVQALGKYRRMPGNPQLVFAELVARVRVLFHALPGLQVVGYAEANDLQLCARLDHRYDGY